jgi:hypothetical protein
MKINLASTRLAFVLLAVLAGLILLSALIPQRDFAQHQIMDWREALGSGYVVIEKLNLDRIYTSPVFLITIALLSVSLVAGNVKRIGRLTKIRNTRTRMRLLGSIVFHFALLLVVGGAVLNHMYRFRVVFGLTEGQRATTSPDSYFRDLSGPWCQVENQDFVVGVDQVHPELQVGDVTTEAAEISVARGSGAPPASGIIRVNHPLRRDGLEFHLGARIGYSPEVAVTGGDGEKLFRSFVRLAHRPGHDEMVDSDFVFLPEDSTRILLSVSDGDESGPQAQTLVTVERDGQELYNGYPGIEGEGLPGGGTIAVPRLRRWCYVEAIRNPFMSVVFAGFWIALAGLVITLVPRLMPARSSAS